MTSQRGFGLIELMIVVAILTVFSVAAISGVRNHMSQGKVITMLATMHGMAAAGQSIISTSNTIPDTNTDQIAWLNETTGSSFKSTNFKGQRFELFQGAADRVFVKTSIPVSAIGPDWTPSSVAVERQGDRYVVTALALVNRLQSRHQRDVESQLADTHER